MKVPKIIMPSDSALHYMGRIERKNPNAPVFYWAGSLVTFAFSGSYLSVCVDNHNNYNIARLGYILDGAESQLVLSSCADFPQECVIPVSGEGLHTFTLFKRQDDPHYFTLRGISIAQDAEIRALPDKSTLKLEFFGDSVTAGSVCEAIDHVGQIDPPVYDSSYDNAWHSYAMQTARLLNAQVHLTAQGGIALLDNSGYFDNGRFGMESTYDKLCYVSYAAQRTAWDFTQYQPDFVILAIGQNDRHFDGIDCDCFPHARRERWLKTYREMVSDLLGKYPQAQFLLTLTILQHDPYWETLLDDACDLIADPRVMRFRFSRTGQATPGHPRIPEHTEMAEELAAFILTKLG